MKRVLILMMICLLIIPAARAEGEYDLLRYAVELGRELDAMSEDEAYFAQYDLSESLLTDIRVYGAENHDTPVAIRAVDLTEYMQISPEWETLPEAVRRQSLNRVPASAMQMYVRHYGIETMLMLSILRADVTFAAPETDGRGLWIMEYEDAASIGVTWYAENGAVHMQAAFLPENLLENEALTTRVVAAARPVLDEYALSLAEEIRSIARNDAYLNMLGLSHEIVGTVRSYVAEEDQQPRLILCALTDDDDAAEARLLQEISYLSVVQLSAVSSTRSTVIFADPDASGTGLYLFLYEDGVPIIVQWRGENGAYHLTAAFQPGEKPFSCRSAEDASAWAEGLGLRLRFLPMGMILLP